MSEKTKFELGQEISFTFYEWKGKGIIQSINKLGVIVKLTTDVDKIKKGFKHFAVFYDEIDEKLAIEGATDMVNKVSGKEKD